VLRDGVAVEAVITPELRPDVSPPRIGVRPLPRIVAGIRPGHPVLERLGLQRNDVVIAIDGRTFLGGDLAVAATGPEATTWLVERGGEPVLLEQRATAAERATIPEHVALAGDDRSLMLLPMPEGPAARAGLLPGDRVLRVGDADIGDWDDLRTAVEGAGDQPLRLQVRRPSIDSPREDAAEVVELTIRPRREPVHDLGFDHVLSHRTEEVRATSVGDALRLGTVCSLDLVKQLYVTLKRLVTGDVAAKNLGGIIRIGQASYQAARRGPSWFWYFLALLSVNLAFVNLLPVPVLDGGHLLFLLIEKVKGSPVSTRVLGYSQVVGLVFVLLLVLFVTYNDILRLL
jgi:regulator of sigma E protease